VEIVVIVVQIAEEVGVILSTEALEKFISRFEYIYAPNSLFVAQPFAGQSVVSAKPSVGFHGGAIDVKGEDIRRHGACVIVSRITMDAVKNRIQLEFLQ
jgi:hypothetical protein